MHKTRIFFISMLNVLILSCATQNSNKYTSIEYYKLSAELKDPIEFIHNELRNIEQGDKVQEKLSEVVRIITDKKQQTATSYLKEQLFLRAQFSYQEGSYDQSALFLEAALKLSPSDIYLETRYAISLVRMGRLSEAQEILEKVYAKDSDDKTGLLLAGVQVSLEKMSEAREVYKSIMARNPKSLEACLFLGKSYSRDKKWAKATAELKKCAVSMPNKAQFPFELAKVYLSQKNLKNAKKQLQQSLKIQPDFSQAVLTLGAVLEDQKEVSDAYELYTKYLESYPQDYLVLNKMISWHLDRDEGVKAIPYVEKIVDIDTSNNHLRVRLGILYVEAGNLDQAISLFKELLVTHPEAEKVHYYLAAVYQEQENFENALEHYSQVPTTSALFDDSSLQIANILSALAENSSEGEDRFVGFVRERQDRTSIAFELSVLEASYFEKKNDYAKAIAVLERLKNNDKFQESHMFYMVTLYEKNEQFDKVDEELSAYIEKNPENAQALNFLGYSYLERGERDDKAFEYISKALSLRPNDGYIRDSMGWYYYKKGQYQKSLTYLKKAYKDSANDNEVGMHLAQTYQALGLFEEAVSLYQRAYKHNKSPSVRKEIAESIEKVLRLKNANRLPASK